MEKNYDLTTKMLRKPLRKTSQNGDHCTVKTFKEAKSHWLPLLLTLALSLLMGQAWAQQSYPRTETKTQTYTSGSGSWTAPAGTWKVTNLQAWGAGGGGGNAGRQKVGCGGGGGGAYAGYSTVLNFQPGQKLDYSVGAGGNGGSAGGNSYVTANGSIENNAYVNAGGGKSPANNTNAGADGGTVIKGTGYPGGKGGTGRQASGAFSAQSASGGGGGGAGTSGPGGANNNAPGDNAGGAAGQGASQGGGNGGAGVNYGNNGNNGNNGNDFGGGGSGAAGSSLSNGQTGGKGGPGRIIITYEVLTLNVTFNKNTTDAVTGMPTDKQILYYDAYSTINIPSLIPARAGWYFLGWFTDPEGGSKIEPSTIHTSTENITLYAHWDIDPGEIAGSTTINPCGSFGVTADPVSGATSYMWTYTNNTTGEVFTITGATAANLPQNTLSLSVPGTYVINRYAISNQTGNPILSEGQFTVTVQSNVPAGSISTTNNEISSRAAYSITGNNQDSQYAYQWAYKTPGATEYNVIPGATGQNLTSGPSLVASGDYTFVRYTRIAGCDYGGVPSNAITIHVEMNGDQVCFDYVNDNSRNWTAPEGTYKVTIEAWGGGGAGGNATDSRSVGSGGGGGGYILKELSEQNFHANAITYTVGRGGLGGARGQSPRDGDDSKVTYKGKTYTAGGGKVGAMATAPTTGTQTNRATGGTGGSGDREGTSGGDVSAKRNGTNNFTISASGAGGKGGNTAGTQTDGGGGQSISNNSNNHGNGGFAPGGGGSGARKGGISNTYYGGAGGNGKVCFTYEILQLQYTTNVNYGGSASSTPSTTLYYDTINISNPTREGFTFLGWFDAPTGGNKVEFEKSGNVYLYNHAVDLYLYAHWKIDSGAIASGSIEILPCANFSVSQSRPASDGSTYKWFYTKDNGLVQLVAGATSATLSQDNISLSATGSYVFHRVALNAGTGDSLVSDGAYTVTVRDINGGTIATNPTTIYPGQTYAITSSEADADVTNYSWAYKRGDAAYTPIDANTVALSQGQVPELLSEGTYKFVRYTTYTDCGEDIVKPSNELAIVVKINPGAISGNTTILPCGAFSIASQTDAQGQSSYKWIYKKESASTWDTLNVNAATLSQENITLNEPATYLFNRLAVNNVGGTTPTAQAVTITVTPIPGGTIIANPTTIVSRNTYAITGSDAGEQFTYQWAYKKPGESNYTDIPDATGKDLSNAPVLSALGNYEFIRYTLISGCDCQAGTATTSITVELESHKVCFETPGDTTWTAPEGTYKVTIEAWGGGGAGGGAPLSGRSSTRSVGGGGGGGAYAQSSISNQNFHIQPFTVSVGNGGAASAAAGEAGNPSTVVFNTTTLVKADGGKGGKYNTTTSTSTAITAEGGQGGSAENSIGNSMFLSSGEGGDVGYNNRNNTPIGGKGGDAAGTEGTGGQQVTCESQQSAAGNQGNRPGGGGSGAINRYTTTAQTGGAGGDGQVCLTYEILELQLITNQNYGNAKSDTTLVLYYDTVQVANPTREGYVFAGWYDAATDGNLVTFDSTGNFALYNHTTDLELFAQWAVDAGSIATNTGAQRICKDGNYAIVGSTVTVPNVTYSWKYTLYKSDGTSSTNNLSVNQPSLSPDYFELQDPGLYEFTRLVDAADDNFGPQTSANTFKINVVAPNQEIEGLDVNYSAICNGGKVLLTPNMELAKIFIPKFDNPSQKDTLEAKSVVFEYTADGGTSWNPYENDVTPLAEGTPSIRAIFSYTNLDGCNAYSKPVDITVVEDPTFTTKVVTSEPAICPNGSVSFTAGELSQPSGITDNPDYHYTWKILYGEETDFVSIGTEATYRYEDSGKVVYASNFLETGEIFYIAIAENVLGCSAQSNEALYEDDDEEIGGYGYVQVSEINPPIITQSVTCPIADSTFDFATTVSGGDGYLWYADATTMTEENETPTHSLAAEDTVVWYVAVKDDECNSARVPDTLVVRYTAHIAQTSENSTLQQEVCQFTDITPITFKFDGNAYPEYTGTLPAGVKAVIDTNAQTYTISGTPTVDGNFDFTVKLQDGANEGDCSQPTQFPCKFQVNPTYNNVVKVSACEFPATFADLDVTFDAPGTKVVEKQTSLGCDSNTTVICSLMGWNQFGYEENQTLLAGWSKFDSWSGTTIPADCDGSLSGSVITYDASEWNGDASVSANNTNLPNSDALCNDGGKSLALPSRRGGIYGYSTEENNNSSIIMKTSTDGYGLLNLHFDYKTKSRNGTNDKSLSSVEFFYKLSEDGEWKSAKGGSYMTMDATGSIDISDFPEEMFNQETIWLKFTFGGAAVAMLSENQNLLLDNICLSGQKGIDEVKLDENAVEVCRGEYVTLTASDPYVDCYQKQCDTAYVLYTWTKTAPGEDPEVLGEEGNVLRDQPTVNGTTYTVSVGSQSCTTTSTCEVTINEPIDRTEDNAFGPAIIREQSWCASDLSNFVFHDSELDEDIPGAKILSPSIAEMQEAGTYNCRLSLGSLLPAEATACDSIIRLDLTVLPSYNEMIYANICLGESYQEYGFDITPTEVGTEMHIYNGTTTLGCDSIVTLVLTTNSVKQTLTDLTDQLMVAWPLNLDLYRLFAKCGNQTVGAKMIWAGSGILDVADGSSSATGTCYEETTNKSIRLANGDGGNGGDYWGPFDGTYFEIKINPQDYDSLKLKFDYKKGIDAENSSYTNVGNAFNTAKCYYKFNEGDAYQLAGTANLTSSDWSNASFDLSSLATLDEPQLFLKVEYSGGKKGEGRSYWSGFARRYQYYPAYLYVDNIIVRGNKPARATLAANPTATYIPTGSDAQTTVAENNEISICRDAEVTFTIQQKDSVYFTFFVRDPNGADTAFGGLTTMTLAPQTTGDYYIVAHDNITGCDSLYTFPVTVNEYAVIADCSTPAVCSGAPLSFAPNDAPVNTTYTWGAPTNNDIDFNTLSGSNGLKDSLTTQMTSLSSTNIVNVVYTLTPSTGGCPGTPFEVTVPVLPSVNSTVSSPAIAKNYCHGEQDITCTIAISNIYSTVSRQMVWEFNGIKDTVSYADQTGNTMSPTKNFSLPATPCDTTYKVYATYTDGAGCIAKDTITLKVDIPAHSFTFAEADNDSTVYCLADATEPSTLVPEAYSGCGDTLTGVRVGTYVDNPTPITCSGTRTYTYKYTDCKGQDTTWQYVYTISHKAPEMKENAEWPADSFNQPKVFAQADTSCLYSDDRVKALFEDNCRGNSFTVTHIQTVDENSDCRWKITRTYTIANDCGDIVTPKPTQSVSGSDQTAPTYTRPADAVAYLQLDGTVDADTSKTGVPTNVSDNSTNKCDTTYRDETYTYACGVTFNRIWRVTDACGNVSLSDSVQKITVQDTLTPRIAGNWADDTVYLTAYNACGYTLPDTLKTVAEVNALKADFIKGQNLNPAITMHQDTTNKNACNMYILRTYTVTDTCNSKFASFTHKILVKDTTKPALAGSWPADSTGQNHIYADADTSCLKSDADIKELFNDCHEITVTHTQAPTLVSNCGWTIVRTYHIEDACGNGFDSTMRVSGANQNAPMYLTDAWPNSVTGQDNCLANADTSSFLTDSAAAKKFTDTCGVYVTHKDSVVEGSTDCEWTIIRTYFVQDSCHNSVTPNPELRVSGSDQSAPVFAEGKSWPTSPETAQNACLANADKSALKSNEDIKSLFEDCGTFDVTSKDDTTGTSCEWTITRTYTIKDACNNIYYTSGTTFPTMRVSGKDTSAPVLAVGKQWPADQSTLDYCKKDVPAGPTKAYIKALFTDCNDLLVDSLYVVEGSDCAWTAHYIYEVSDNCLNSFKDTVTFTGSDQTAPALTGIWPSDSSNINKSKADIPAGPTKAAIKALFTDCADVTVDSVRNVTGTDCEWTAKFCYQIKDNCHTVYDTVTYTGGDNEEPKFVCPQDTTLNLAIDGTVDASPEKTGKPTEVSDNYTLAADMNIFHIDRDTTANCGKTFSFVREWHVADTCGNDSVKTQTITVIDTMKPIINCKDVAQEHATDLNKNTFKQNVVDWDVSATDNNAISTITYVLSGATTGNGANTLNGVTFNTGKTLVTWTVTDVCGNDTTCTDTIKIVNTNPITVYISEKTDTVVYDGQEHTLTGYVVDSISNNLYTVADFKLKESAINDTIVKGTLVGSYSMNLNQDDFEKVSPYFNNIHFNVTSRDLVIKQNPATITIASGSHTFDASEYDGQPHYFPSYVVTYNGESVPHLADSTKFELPTGDTLSVTPTGSVTSAMDNRDKNNTFTWTLQNANCYANQIDTNGRVGTIRFDAFPQKIVVESKGKTWVYDGQEHSYPMYSVKFGDEYATRFADDTTKFILPITGDTVRIQSTASITNVGKVANTFTYTIDHEEMYVGSSDTIIDTLRMIPLTGVEVTIVERTDTATYDGAMHYVTGYDVANISSTLYSASYFSYNGDDSHKTAAGRYAGTYPMGVLSTDFVNMNTNFDGVIFTIVDRDLVIKPIESNIQITANNAEKNYDGTSLTEAGYTHTMTGALVAGDTIVAVVTGSQTEVGSSANVVTAYYVLRKTSATTFDTITYCYTFATPATVAGTLRVNNAFVVVSKDSVDVDCYGNHNGTVTIVVEGGKLDNDKYNYEMLGPNSFRVVGQTDATLYLRGLYPGAYTVTFKDGLDSTVTATFSINQPDTMVAEIAAPEELCPNQGSYPVSVTVTGGNGTNAYVWGSNATNADADSTVVAQIGASDCRTEYTAAVQVTDAKGCVAKDTVKFKVVDNEAPSFTVPADITLCRNADGQIDAPTSETGVPTNYSDNCSNEATMIRHTTFRDIDTTGNVNNLMIIRREWTVTDSCGNPTVKVQNITIKPGIGVAGSDYVLTAPENIEITLKYGQVDTLLTNIGTAVASNLPVDIAEPIVTSNKPANDRYPEGTTEVVWTATDECGFTVTATQTIVVNYPLCEPVTYYGYEYPAVRIGGNCWLAENLRNTQYADGANVPNYSSYNNDGNMTDDYGLLYSWYSAVRVPENNDNVVPEATVNGYVQGLCPDDWALPKQTDFDALMNASGTTNVLKDVNAQYWLPGAAGITPSTGFDARGAGYYDASIDRYMNLLGEVYFWSSEAGATVTQGKCSVITHYCPELINYEQNKVNGFSVRCIRKR